MQFDPKELKRRTEAAMVILNEGSTTLEKVRSVAGLLKGVNKKLDTILLTCETQCAHIELATQGAVVELALESMPEDTEEQKKRKKTLLIFIKSWGELKSEVSRLQTELDMGHSVSDPSFFAKALSAAKGPFAIITLLALGVVALSQVGADIVVANDGCPTLVASGVSVSIPGLRLPSTPITAGGAETVTIPALTLTIDGRTPQVLIISSLLFTFDFTLSSAVTDVTFDGASLLGTVTELNLGREESHTLTVKCS